jgi:tetratricopeptide (TPR) repeat protein
MNVSLTRILVCMIAGAFSLHAELTIDKSDPPRVMVILDEKIDNADAASHKASLKIETALKAHGYRVVDAKQFDLMRQRDTTMREMNPKKAMALARRLGAEILITGDAVSLPGGERETFGFKSYVYVADARVKAQATETGEVLGLFNTTAEKASQTKPTAAIKTLETVGDSLGVMICASLHQAFDVSQERTIELVVQGVDDASLQKITSDLSVSAPVMRTVAVRFMEGDAATFDCTIRGSIEDARKQLASAKNFVVAGSSGSRIDVLYRTRAGKKTAARTSAGLEITRFTAEKIFPALALHYVKHPIGTATIKNTSAADIVNITAKIFTTGYMRESSEQTIPILKAGEEKSIAVFALLDADKLTAVVRETSALIRIDLTYEAAGDDYSRSIVKPVSILNKHAMAWSEPSSVATFVTPASEAITSFTKSILADVRHDEVLMPSGSINMMNAVKMWNAIQAMTLVYADGPRTVAGKDVLGDVKYPQETLSMRAGDCDDASTLLAACLESVGVPTAIAVTPNEVFILFDTGVQKKNAARISVDEHDYILRGGTLWLPLETTIANGSFLLAWKNGIKEYNEASKGLAKFEVVDIHNAWELYPPIDLSSDVKSIVIPPASLVVDLVSADVKMLTQDLMSTIEDDVAALHAQKTEGAADRAALLLTIANKYDDAANLLKNYVSSASLNNLGNIYFMKGDSLNAYRAYQSALKADHNDAGIVLNLGVLKFIGGDDEAASASLREGMELLDSKERAYEMLGFPAVGASPVDRKAGEKEKGADKAELKRLLDSVVKDIAVKKANTPAVEKARRGENKFIFGGRRVIDPMTVISLKDILYWKFS